MARCPSKEAADRPTAGELRDLLAVDTPDGAGQLPDSVVQMIAARSAEGPVLPEIEPTVLDESAAVPAPDDGEPRDAVPHGLSRRRLLLA
ncbi:serine/threonine protein kinase, partial [Streptomyces sp. NPDC006875]